MDRIAAGSDSPSCGPTRHSAQGTVRRAQAGVGNGLGTGEAVRAVIAVIAR
jgi:hypothetical protein